MKLSLLDQPIRPPDSTPGAEIIEQSPKPKPQSLKRAPRPAGGKKRAPTVEVAAT